MAGLALADGGVESANIVGYQDVTLTEQYTILGVNFVAVDGTSNIALNDAIPYATGMTKGNKDTLADKIQIQDGTGGYKTYFMSNGKNAKGNKTIDGLDGKWTTAMAGDEYYVPATITLAPGTAFWYVRQNTTGTQTVKIVGGVSVLGSNSKGIDEYYKHIANPYPTDLPLNPGIPYVAGMTKGNKDTLADKIQIQDGTGGYKTYFMSNGYNAKGNKTIDGLDGKWTTAMAGDEYYVPATTVIPAGKGAWFVRKGDTDITITIARPFNIE